MRTKLVWRALLSLAGLAAACSAPVTQPVPVAESAAAPAREPSAIWVAYVRRGTLHRVRADGSKHARLRSKKRRVSPETAPDVKVYDVWIDPAPRPGAEAIAVIRGRNLSFSVHPGDPADFDQSWELVLVDPTDPQKDRVLHTSRRRLDRLRWSDDGTQLLARVGRRDVLLWSPENCRTHSLVFAAGEAERPRLLLADFTRDGSAVHVLMDSYLDTPYLIGTASLVDTASLIDTATLQEEKLRVTPLATFRSFDMPQEVRQSGPAKRLLGNGVAGSAFRPPFQLTPDRRFSFYFRKRDGWFARGWIEGVDANDGSTFEVRTITRGLYVE